jgi:hypothetical protein
MVQSANAAVVDSSQAWAQQRFPAPAAAETAAAAAAAEAPQEQQWESAKTG